MTKILVIEDEESIRYDILEILEIEAFETEGAVNGLDGVEKAIQYQPDLILCDVTMPKLDGYGVLEQIRQNSATALIPFIFLSANAERASQRRGMNLGADDYLTKPISRSDLLEAIATQLRKKATSDSYYHDSLETALQETLHKIAYIDVLTGLLNRLSLRQHLAQVIKAASEAQELVSIFVIDIDRFRRINETLGQLSGDTLLQAIATRLTKCVGAKHSIARVNADEFIIIIANTNRDQESKLLAQAILDQLSQPFYVGDREVYITASIGIALYPEHGTNIEILFNHVNIAMQMAKAQGGNGYCIYQIGTKIEIDGQLELETHLYRALERHELKLYYQPQICLKTGRMIGAEALLRWHHSHHGFIPPMTFIPLAEKNGSIIPIGEWVIRQACQDLKIWHQALKRRGSSYSKDLPRVAVNISGRQFQQSSLAINIVNILAETDVDPSYLELELTESTIVQDVKSSISKLSYLKSLGITMSLDDFGTGYSSLSYLRQFPIDTLKIDQSFIRNITNDQKNRAIAIAIIQLAHNMNLKVLAEGVETREELEILRQHQCDEIQGFVFSKPIPALDFQNLLLENQRL